MRLKIDSLYQSLSRFRKCFQWNKFPEAFWQREVDILFSDRFFYNFGIVTGAKILKHFLYNIFRGTGAGCDEDGLNAGHPDRINFFDTVDQLSMRAKA